MRVDKRLVVILVVMVFVFIGGLLVGGYEAQRKLDDHEGKLDSCRLTLRQIQSLIERETNERN